MALLPSAFKSLADLKLWFDSKSGATPKLSEVPELIPLRWPYFRDNWEFILPIVKSKMAQTSFPDELDTQLKAFTAFIQVQRNNANKNINPFSKSSILTDFYNVWDNIEVSSIPLTRQEQGIVQDKVTRVLRFIKTDFVAIKKSLAAARDEIADVTGTEDAEYNTVFHRSSVRTLRPARIKDISNMQTLQSGIKSVDFILANSASLNTTTIDPFALARQNANNPDIEIQTNRSGRLVRMFYGDSLEDLAYRYFGDQNRWIEIAIANGLKAPYIDEAGEAIKLLSNGSGNQLNINATDVSGNRNREKFFINQALFLQSDSVKFPDQRTVVNIREIPVSGELVIELDGDHNLDIYTTTDNAYARVFLPNTINSNFMIMIPSPEAPDTLPSNEVPFFLASKKEDERRAGVDLAYNDNRDLVLTSSGDLQLSFGLANAVQAMQIKMISEKGQNPHHPLFGLPVVVGQKAKDSAQIKQALITGINEMVDADTRFDRVETLNVKVDRGVVNINLVVRMAGTGTLVPISFTVNTG